MDSKSTIKLSVIIPTYNEVDRIGNTLKQLHKHFKNNLGSYEVIVVDADSPDGTAKQAQKSAELFRHFKVISAGPKPKKGSKRQTGKTRYVECQRRIRDVYGC